MAKKHRGGQRPGQWKGGAVEDQPKGEAERAAERAEGNEPVRADAETRRLHSPDLRTEPESVHHRPSHDAGPEEEIAEAAEEHQARDAAEHSPRGKL